MENISGLSRLVECQRYSRNCYADRFARRLVSKRCYWRERVSFKSPISGTGNFHRTTRSIEPPSKLEASGPY
jgi:hypothetical protein